MNYVNHFTMLYVCMMYGFRDDDCSDDDNVDN